ncbi:hypothetical protein PRIPAC_96577 [Pristionchus pacificus]|uniref:Uncharacterized protein n=1 Tax=Pristionchus pacificus TaxID=54126 RepID=A0A2A6D1R3_PRIPA|nr:hypothetical protein PRIPAC_96577 [Pristionchus pacificus]|eukprot:PDM84241.1 hypothetical protein PRIPAC_33264 [Pristionchus pacificus]
MLLAALFAASAGLRTASACHPTLQAAERITEFLEGSGEGKDDCVLLHYDCPTGEDCVEPTQVLVEIMRRAIPYARRVDLRRSADYLLRVGKGSSPYDVIFCRAGAWTVPSGVTLDDVIAESPNFYCQRMQPNAI